MTNLTPELIEKAKVAKTAEELLALAKENGIELTEESAKAYFEQLHKNGELSENELENVAGGGCYRDGKLVVTHMNGCNYWRCYSCGEKTTTNTGLIFYDNLIPGTYYHACKTDSTPIAAVCGNCKYSDSDAGLLVCTHPSNCK